MDCAECFMDAMAAKGMPCADACKDADKDTCFDLMENDACEDCGEEGCHEMCGACGDCGSCFESLMDDGEDDKPAMKKMKPAKKEKRRKLNSSKLPPEEMAKANLVWLSARMLTKQ